MSKQKARVLIAVTWTVAVILGVLPWVWPRYRHLIATPAYQGYEFEAAGFLTGVVTMKVIYQRRAARESRVRVKTHGGVT